MIETAITPPCAQTRLTGRNAYAPVFAFRCSAVGALFEVYGRPNGISRARFGVIVSKRVMRSAVSRNYCKRLAREVLRRERAVYCGLDIVVRARAALVRAMNARAQAEMRCLIRRVRSKCDVRVTAAANAGRSGVR